jgi:hypothetical protein
VAALFHLVNAAAVGKYGITVFDTGRKQEWALHEIWAAMWLTDEVD